jgi:hypothetical protein
LNVLNNFGIFFQILVIFYSVSLYWRLLNKSRCWCFWLFFWFHWISFVFRSLKHLFYLFIMLFISLNHWRFITIFKTKGKCSFNWFYPWSNFLLMIKLKIHYRRESMKPCFLFSIDFMINLDGIFLFTISLNLKDYIFLLLQKHTKLHYTTKINDNILYLLIFESKDYYSLSIHWK